MKETKGMDYGSGNFNMATFKSKKCRYCSKTTDGLSQTQADYNIKIHEMSCYKERKGGKK